MKVGQVVITKPVEGFSPFGWVVTITDSHVIVEAGQSQWASPHEEVTLLVERETQLTHRKWFEQLWPQASFLRRGNFLAKYALIGQTAGGILVCRVEDAMLFVLSEKEWQQAVHPRSMVQLPPFTAAAHLWEKAAYRVELAINYTGIHRTCTISVSQTHPHTHKKPAVDTVDVWPPDQLWADVAFLVETYVGNSDLHLQNVRQAWMQVVTQACAYEAGARYQSLRTLVQEEMVLRIA